MVSNAVMLTFLYAIEPVYNVLNMSLSEDYFRLLMLIVVVVLVAILAERIEKIRKLNELNQKLKIQTDKLEDANQELEAFAPSWGTGHMRYAPGAICTTRSGLKPHLGSWVTSQERPGP